MTERKLNNSLIEIKKSNFISYISQLETVKQHYALCKKAVDEYYDFHNINTTTEKEWLIKYIELGLFFEDIFDLGFFFNNEESSHKDDLLLLDNSAYGFKIKASRDDFEYEIKFKLIFENLFYEKKIYPEKLNEIKNLDDDIPF